MLLTVGKEMDGFAHVLSRYHVLTLVYALPVYPLGDVCLGDV